MTPQRFRKKAVGVGSGVERLVDVVTALRRAALRPRSAQGYVHVGPAVLEEAAKLLSEPVEGDEGSLLDDDGPVLLELREAIGDELEQQECWRNDDGEEFIPNDPAVEALANAVSDRVKAALAKDLRPQPPALDTEDRERWPDGFAPMGPLSQEEVDEAVEAAIAGRLNEVYMSRKDSATVWAEAALQLQQRLDALASRQSQGETKREKLDAEFDAAIQQSEGTEGHRLKLSFDDGLRVDLTHPESGCRPPTQCAICAADLRDPEAKRCYDCKDLDPEGDECWLTAWVDEQGDELIRGTVTLPVAVTWETDYPLFYLPLEPQGEEGERDGVREALVALMLALTNDGELDEAVAMAKEARRIAGEWAVRLGGDAASIVSALEPVVALLNSLAEPVHGAHAALNATARRSALQPPTGGTER